MNEEQNPQDPYVSSLLAMTIDQLVLELKGVQDQIEMVFTMSNSLDGEDITEGGGTTADQDRYQTLLTHQKLVTQEIDKRHMLDMLK